MAKFGDYFRDYFLTLRDNLLLSIGKYGGGSGIRTRDTVSRIHAFQACAFSHSATPPDACGKIDERCRMGNKNLTKLFFWDHFFVEKIEQIALRSFKKFKRLLPEVLM